MRRAEIGRFQPILTVCFGSRLCENALKASPNQRPRLVRGKGADNIRLILRNLTQLTNNLAQLRGLYGTGHGRDGQHRGLQPRHARLAVASAVAFIDFVSETFRHREGLN
ncbi:abortive infection family protein [Pseudomonas sp. PGPR40]|uniref:abortive infection family protein n=1 Tax=Pseudomonas sp. PGPR40 TaxID=2913476 RepID=UPI0022AA9E5A|nr:abortive infection family protein [Pseudomonas sp. PGPR40]